MNDLWSVKPSLEGCNGFRISLCNCIDSFYCILVGSPSNVGMLSEGSFTVFTSLESEVVLNPCSNLLSSSRCWLFWCWSSLLRFFSLSISRSIFDDFGHGGVAWSVDIMCLELLSPSGSSSGEIESTSVVKRSRDFSHSNIREVFNFSFV